MSALHPRCKVLAASPAHYQPYAAASWVASGLLLLLCFTRPSEWTWTWTWTYSPRTNEVVWLGLTGWLALQLVAVALALAAAARGRSSDGSRLRLEVLTSAAAVQGLGAGVFAARALELASDESATVVLCLMHVSMVATLAAIERGLRPLAPLSGYSLAFALGLLLEVHARGLERWRDEAPQVALATWIGCLTGYLLVRGLWNLVAERSAGSSGGALGGASLPLEVLERAGGWRVRVEAPGLTSARGIELEVEGPHLRAHLHLVPSAPPAALLFSTRRVGSFTVEVPLPGPVRPQPAAVAVAHGLLVIDLDRAEEAPGRS